MTWGSLFIVLIVITFAFLLSGIWVAVALGIVGVIGLAIGGSMDLISVIGTITWKTVNSNTLTAIPLFMLMGEIVLASGLSKNFYLGVGKFTQKIPGGLLHSNIIACGIFSAISGSSVATAAAIGSASIPEMKALGYKKDYVYGSVTAGGTLGILIPPSISLIIYGSLTSESVVKLFKASMPCGIILMLLYMLVIVMFNIIDKKSFKNVKEEHFNMSVKEALIGIFPFALLIAMVLGGIYAGITTATEAASIGVVVSLIVAKIFGELNFKIFKDALRESIKATSMILFIMVGAQIIAYVLTATSISRQLIAWMTALGLSRIELLIIVYIIYIIMGCFVDGNSMQFMTIPILYPALTAYGIDGIWFGVTLVVLIELGQLTPPLGMNLFVVHGIDSESRLTEIIKGSMPFLGMMVLMIIILTVFPQLAYVGLGGGYPG